MSRGSIHALPLATWIDARRREVDEAVERYLPSAPQIPVIVADAMRYSLRAGGKRLRPLLTLATAEATAESAGAPLDAGRARSLALPAACALEFIHTYSLVHDDLPAMDNDTLRRGRPTLHVVYGEGIAILAGDGLLTEAFALMGREPEDAEGQLAPRRLRAIACLAEAAGAAGMVGGQAIDLQLSGQVPAAATSPPSRDIDALRDMHARKTGALIRAAASLGAIMAGATAEVIDAVDVYGSEVGLAFQIVDDILDVEGTDTALGKTAGKDAAAGKLTYPSLLGVDASRALAREAIARAEAALARVALPRDRLLGLAEWVVARQQ